jgi:hypothetical protein
LRATAVADVRAKLAVARKLRRRLEESILGRLIVCLVRLLWFGFVSLVLCVFVNLSVVRVVKL